MNVFPTDRIRAAAWVALCIFAVVRQAYAHVEPGQELPSQMDKDGFAILLRLMEARARGLHPETAADRPGSAMDVASAGKAQPAPSGVSVSAGEREFVEIRKEQLPHQERARSQSLTALDVAQTVPRSNPRPQGP